MNVPPYFPEPIEVPGNVADEPYRVRILFQRVVVGLHLASTLILASVALGHERIDLNPWTAAFMAGASLLALSVIRLLNRPRVTVDKVLSLLVALPLLVGLGRLVVLLPEAGWPLAGLIGGLAGWYAYVVVCGRDYSFLGQFGLAVVGALVGSAWVQSEMGTPYGLRALVLGLGYPLYLTIDLALLVRRRTKREGIAAALDLYRDVLNGFTYPWRVVQHWRKHPIGPLERLLH